MGRKRGLVCGVGINDADYVITRHQKINGKSKQVWLCPFYRSWKSMLVRCYWPKYQERFPTYFGCSVCEAWLKFSVFKSWMEAQEWQGMALDKDTLLVGNKVYSPEFCIFITPELNAFTTDCAAARGEYPLGVSLSNRTGKFQAECNNPFSGGKDALGYFDCSDVAHEAWRARKHQHACRYADMQTDSRIALALRTRYLPEKEII